MCFICFHFICYFHLKTWWLTGGNIEENMRLCLLLQWISKLRKKSFQILWKGRKRKKQRVNISPVHGKHMFMMAESVGTSAATALTKLYVNPSPKLERHSVSGDISLYVPIISILSYLITLSFLHFNIYICYFS